MPGRPLRPTTSCSSTPRASRRRSPRPCSSGSRAGSGSTTSSPSTSTAGGNGKERCTLRHVLDHTGGFPNAGRQDLRRRHHLRGGRSRTSRRARAEWEPGTAAGVPPVERLEGARRGRRGRRRPTDRPVPPRRGLRPVGIDRRPPRHPGRRAAAVRRPARARCTGAATHAGSRRRRLVRDGRRTGSTRSTTSRGTSPRSSPAAALRAPARELGRFYESLLGYRAGRARAPHGRAHGRGAPPRHRGPAVPAEPARGVSACRSSFTGGTGRRAFGHGGHGVVTRSAPTRSSGS